MKSILRRLLAVPLYYKIVVANVAILVAAMVLHSAVSAWVTVGIAMVANALIVRLALDVEKITRRHERERVLSRKALSAAEDERKRVAGDLHDKTAQTLAGLLVRLSLLQRVNDAEVRTSLIKEAADEAAFAMDEVYRVVQALRPPALEMLGLKGAIEAYARSVGDSAQIDINVDSDDLRGALDEQAEIALYRILQEAVNNVVRHANATTANIEIRRTADGIIAKIEDNGVGFTPSSQSGETLGFFGMQERAGYLGGTIEIRSGHGGTTVEVEIPVPQDL